MQYELGFIGAGNMAEAIVRGVLRAGLFPADQIIAADVAAPRRELFARELGVRCVETNDLVAKDSRRIVLSVKPQMMAAVLAPLGPLLAHDPLFISIAAGISTAFIEKNLGAGRRWRVVRTMPNTPMLVGEGMVGIAPGANATEADLVDARRIFEAAAQVVQVREDQLDAVTAMSGSGPAYFFYLVEHMIRAGQSLGLTPAQSRQLAATTALGAARMLTSGDDSPEELRRRVTSPGGTTHAAITTLDSRGVGDAIVAAIVAADKRSKELGV